MVALLSDCKPVIRMVEKIDLGIAPQSAIEARIQLALETRKEGLQDTYLAWVKGTKTLREMKRPAGCVRGHPSSDMSQREL